MLHEFLTSNRKELIARCRTKAGKRFEPTSTSVVAHVDHGVPLFLQQLVDILRVEQLTDKREGSEAGPTASSTEIGRAAALHGRELLRLGFSVDQVVHGYGDVCQSVTELAVEEKEPITTDEFRTLNRCLDNAIADAVTAFGNSNQTAANAQAKTVVDRLDAFSAEQKRLVDIADQAYSAIKSGNIGLTGATGTLLVHTLSELRSLPERALPEIRLGRASAKTAAR